MDKLLDGQTLEDHAIEVIRQFSKGRTYHVAYSGGKDSDTVLHLVKSAGVDFHTVYNYCPLDPPEVRSHIREISRDPTNRFSYNMPATSLIAEARRRKIMPLRNRRWCCEVLKERPSETGEPIITGIRWEESPRRKKRHQIEACRRINTFFVHPIIGWKYNDVWSYLHQNNIPTSSLYAEGFTRVGCVLCPMTRDTDRQIKRWPGQARIWRQISHEVWNLHGFQTFRNEDEQWEWWLDRDAHHSPERDDCPLFDTLDTVDQPLPLNQETYP